ncbi:hypothetical protein [Thalassotalea mangrovi]|uniref:Uncharacterized protein n=1 Tax=Thalassotalea mangrovi TaxID=2572245 RepID=A0A4U1B5R9_9GAMM|nr:hypothetical protein [Thalassotalea mangrovi]TKB45721.1 hypothetical protein E8M12_07250 [Thalassotalea mangrovi]
MLSSLKENPPILPLLLLSGTLIIFSEQAIIHGLGLALYLVFFWAGLKYLNNQAIKPKRLLLSAAQRVKPSVRLARLSLFLLIAIESGRYFPEQSAVAIALFAILLTFREWLGLRNRY